LELTTVMQRRNFICYHSVHFEVFDESVEVYGKTSGKRMGERVIK
jgi:hypothetical protein